MKYMKIPNKAVLAMIAVFLIVGPLVLPIADWGWRWLHLGVVLVVGFLLSTIGILGAGDAKFLAAMAPFVDRQDTVSFIIIFAAVLPAAFVTHRLFRASGPVRRLTGDWESWSRTREFPFGLPLAGILILYLVFALRF